MMKLNTWVLLMVFSYAAEGMGQTNKIYDLFVGTYTNADKTNGIHIFRFNSENGQLTPGPVTRGITNPSYLAVSSDNKHVYAVSEVGRGQAKAYSYTFDAATGNLTVLNSVPAGGDGPCYISAHPGGKFVFTGMYSAGTLSAIPVNTDGSLGTDSQIFKYEGSSVNKQNQSRPHVHAALPSPDGKYILATDLGTDKIYSYRYNPKNAAPLSSQSTLSVKPGSGPRHMAFHPNGKYLYAVMELTAEVAMMKYKKGVLELNQYTTMLPEGFKGEVEAADIHVSPDGKFLYASNRADGKDIVIYSIASNGKLNYVGRQKELVKTPRGFAIDPSGNFLLVANMDGNNIVVFNRNALTGLLSPTGIQVNVDQPVCLKFAIK